MGYREDQYVVAMKVNMTDSGDLEGTITYKGEGPIAFKGMLVAGCSYSVENQWGGKRAAWNPGGTFVLGTRKDQKPIAFDIMSNNDGKTFTGTMTYYGEGPIGFKATQVGGNVYKVENQWGGKNAAWNPAGQFVIGCRVNQRVVAMKVTSTDNGDHFTGEMTYAGEGPIGFKAVLSELVTAGVKS